MASPFWKTMSQAPLVDLLIPEVLFNVLSSEYTIFCSGNQVMAPIL